MSGRASRAARPGAAPQQDGTSGRRAAAQIAAAGRARRRCGRRGGSAAASGARGSRSRRGRAPPPGGRGSRRRRPISSGSGSRLPGGRHFTTLVMKTSSRAQPMRAQQLVEQLAGGPDERAPGGVLAGAGTLPDQEHVAQRVALAGDGVRPAALKRAARAATDLGRDRCRCQRPSASAAHRPEGTAPPRSAAAPSV